LDPHYRAARQAGAIEVAEYDEGMLQWGLYAAGLKLPFLPTRAGLASDVLTHNPALRPVSAPHTDPRLPAVPAPHLRSALTHRTRAGPHGNGQCLGPDPYFDDLFCMAAEQAFMSCERIVPTAELTANAHPATLRINRMFVTGVVEAPNGAHFTSCAPDYDRDEAFQRAYVTAAADPVARKEFHDRYLVGSESDYQAAVAARRRKEAA